MTINDLVVTSRSTRINELIRPKLRWSGVILVFIVRRRQEVEEDRKNLKKFWLQQTPEDPFQEGRKERITLL